MENLRAATEQVKHGVSLILAEFADLEKRRETLGQEVAALLAQERQAREQLNATARHVSGAQAAHKAALKDLATAEAAAKEKAEFIVAAGRAEAKRLVEEVEATRKTVVEQREAARVELDALRQDVEAARAEEHQFKARVAAAREHFLKAAS